MAGAPTVESTGSVETAAGAARRAVPSLASLFVWGAWALLLALVLACIVRYGRNVPLAEDWLMVAPLTGHEPNLAGWLWAQNNEHRLPLPRLVYLVLLELSGGDFRVGMVANAMIAGAVAAAMLLAARRLRGGRTSWTDAFFPVVLLNLGHWENLVWGWQIQFVLSTALTCVLLVVVVRGPPRGGRATWAAAAALVLLPLCGANGLVFALAMVPWAVFAGISVRARPTATRGERAAGRALTWAGAIAVALVGAYFVGWERPSWTPPNPGVRPSVATAIKFASMGFGPIASHWWTLAAVGAALVLLPAAVLVLRAAWRAWRPGAGTAGARWEPLLGAPWPAERERALGMLCFAGGCAVLTLAMGWGRAALVPTSGMPDRYALLAVPAFCAAYFAWELYGPPAGRRVAEGAFLVAVLATLRGNLREGLSWRDWYVDGAESVLRDVGAGMPRLELARRHREYLMHWDEKGLAARIGWLREAGVGVWKEVRE